jgi:hypothetical protein
MWLTRIVLVLLFGTAVVYGQTIDEKLCIFSAAQKLPSIPGLVIKASRAKEPPKEMKQSSDISAKLVEIDINAAAQEGTYTFLCVFAPGKPTFVSPIGLSR